MATNFKIYLIENLVREKGKEPTAVEVRRFDLPLNASYISLCHKIEILIPCLQGKTYSLFWKDNQGEFISFSSDEEFYIARKEMSLNELKVIYALQAQPKREQDNPQSGQGSCHNAVSCDGCNVTPIVGYRYKCIFCYDYDLCANCEMRGVHNEHVMIRFNKPIAASSMMRNPHHMLKRRFNRLIQSSYGGAETSPCHESSSESDEAFGNPHDCSFKKRHHSKEKREHKHDKKSHRHGFRHEHDKRRRCHDAFRNVAETASAAASAAHAMFVPPGGQPLGAQSIGQLLSYFVDPLGNAGPNEAQCPMAAAFANAGSNNNASSTAAENGNSQPAASATVDNGTAETGGVPASSGTTNAQTSTDQARDQRSESLTNFIQAAMPNLAIAIQEITQNLAQQHVDSPSDDWAVVNAEDKEESVQPGQSAPNPSATPLAAPTIPGIAQPAQPRNSGSLYPDLAPTLTPRHPNPNIQRGIETLLSMGFPNNPDFLTTILEVYDGDIHKALDVLQDHK